MGGGDVSAREEQVGDVTRVEAAEGDAVDAVGVPLVGSRLGGVHPLDRVQVDGPAAEGDVVVVVDLTEDVVLGEHVIAEEPPVFAFSREGADPFEVEVLGLEAAGVLDVVPDAEDDRAQFVADRFVLVDGVEVAAPLDPPVVGAGVSGAEDPRGGDDGLGDVFGGVGGDEVDGVSDVFRVEEDRRPEQFPVGLLGRPRLVVLGGRFTADAVVGAGEEPDESVAGAVEHVGAVEGGEDLGPHGPSAHARDDALPVDLVDVDLAHVGVEEDGDVRFGADGVVDDLVPDDRVALGVAVLVLDVELPDHAALARVPLDPVRGGSDDPHPHLRR